MAPKPLAVSVLYGFQNTRNVVVLKTNLTQKGARARLRTLSKEVMSSNEDSAIRDVFVYIPNRINIINERNEDEK